MKTYVSNRYYEELLTSATEGISDARRILAPSLDQARKLSKYEDLILTASIKKGRTYYYVHRTGKAGKRYVGSDRSPVVQRIKALRHSTQAASDAQHNIDLLSGLADSLLPLDYQAIESRLPKSYRSYTGQNQEVIDPGSAAAKWKEDRERLKSRYPIEHPENLKLSAVDGTLVRSKAEVIIANLLVSYNIPYVYELPHEINGKIYRLDFTALSLRDFSTEIIIEHQGMMSEPAYRDKYMRTLMACLSSDYRIGTDIYFTFDNTDNRFDSDPIMQIIRSRLLPDPEPPVIRAK